MEFYDILSQYYDDIFKLNKATVDMINNNIKGTKILDLACGTGTYSVALNSLGKKVTGVDLDSSMIEKAKKKNKDIEFKVGNMLNLKECLGDEKFHGALCIGNSIVHLNDIKEVINVFKDIYNRLYDDGKFIVQIINYDRILEENIMRLPSIETPNVTFNRDYTLTDDRKIIFRGELETDKGKTANEVELLPMLRCDMEEALGKAGFKNIKFYGSFKGEEYNKDSYALVVCATK